MTMERAGYILDKAIRIIRSGKDPEQAKSEIKELIEATTPEVRLLLQEYLQNSDTYSLQKNGISDIDSSTKNGISDIDSSTKNGIGHQMQENPNSDTSALLRDFQRDLEKIRELLANM